MTKDFLFFVELYLKTSLLARGRTPKRHASLSYNKSACRVALHHAFNTNCFQSYANKITLAQACGKELERTAETLVSPCPDTYPTHRFNLERFTDSSTAPWLINERKTKWKKLRCKKVHASKAHVYEEQQKEKGKSSPNQTCGNCLPFSWSARFHFEPSFPITSLSASCLHEGGKKRAEDRREVACVQEYLYNGG